MRECRYLTIGVALSFAALACGRTPMEGQRSPGRDDRECRWNYIGRGNNSERRKHQCRWKCDSKGNNSERRHFAVRRNATKL